MRCLSCRADNPAGSRFCKVCGLPMDQDAARRVETSSASARCPVCGADTKPGFRHCGACGTALGAHAGGHSSATAALVRKCPSCQTDNKDSAAFCRKCGGVLAANPTTGPTDVASEKRPALQENGAPRPTIVSPTPPPRAAPSMPAFAASAAMARVPSEAPVSRPVASDSQRADRSAPDARPGSSARDAAIMQSASTAAAEVVCDPLAPDKAGTAKAGARLPESDFRPNVQQVSSSSVNAAPASGRSAMSTKRFLTVGIAVALAMIGVALLAVLHPGGKPEEQSPLAESGTAAGKPGRRLQQSAATTDDEGGAAAPAKSVASQAATPGALPGSSPTNTAVDSTRTPALAGAASIAPGAAVAARATSLSGRDVYRQVCQSCHDNGKSGSPRLDDLAGWSNRLEHGRRELYASALNGKGAMPARGGERSLSDEEVRSAVDFIIARVARLQPVRAQPVATRESPGTTQSATAAIPTPMPSDAPTQAVAPAPVKGDWQVALKVEIAACEQGNFLQKTICRERARWKYCNPDRWNAVAECAAPKNTSSANY